MYTVNFTPEAFEEFGAMDNTTRNLVLRGAKDLRNFPRVTQTKPLKKQWKGAWSKRVKDIRIIFVVNKTTREITIVKTGFRKDVYEE